MQRRDAFRVVPALPATLMLRDGERLVEVELTDVAATGVAFLVPPSLGVPALGARIGNAVLELPGFATIACDLVVAHVETRDGRTLAGCRVPRLEPEAQRALQRYVIEVQRQARAARG